MSEIKLCPRCGGQPEIITEEADVTDSDSIIISRVQCPCGACSSSYAGSDREWDATEAWNEYGDIFPNKPIVIDTEYLRKR